jgi:hypothetical protein
MRSPKETALAIEKAVGKVNKFHNDTTSVNGLLGSRTRYAGNTLSFKGRFYKGEKLSSEYMARFIKDVADEYGVPLDHILEIGAWVY